MQLRSVGVLSVAKIMGAIYGLMGLLFIPFFLLIGAAGLLGGGADNKMAGAAAGVGMIVMSLLMPIFYGVMGFVAGAIGAFLYNFLAGRLGGIEMNLQPHAGQAVRATGV